MKKTLTILTVLVIALVAMVGSVNAAATLSVDKTEAHKGDTVIVTLSPVEGAESCEFQLTYDTSKFEFKGTTSDLAMASAKDGVVYYSYVGALKPTKSFGIEFKVLDDAKVGDGAFTVNSDSLELSTGEALGSGSVKVAIVEEPQPTASAEPTEEPTSNPTVKPTDDGSKGSNNDGTKTETEKQTETEKAAEEAELTEKPSTLPQTGAPVYVGAIALIVVSGALVVRKIRK